MATNKVAIWKNPDTEETEVYLSAAVQKALSALGVEWCVVEEDAFGELAAFEAAAGAWKEIPAKVRKAVANQD
jgi:hypothetical protein